MKNTTFSINEYLNEYKRKHDTYADMIQYCTEGKLILNNTIIDRCEYPEIYSGSDYDEETDEYKEIFQYYIITELGAEMLAEHTNEIVYYLGDFDMYLLGVTHYGTAWNGVSANWKFDTEKD